MTYAKRITSPQIRSVSPKVSKHTRGYVPKTSSRDCEACGGVIVYTQATGRPPKYCEGCRSEIRKQQNRINQQNRRKGNQAIRKAA